MDTPDRRPIIAWLIQVYDRTATKRFPLERKWYRFSYDRSTAAQARDVVRLCGHDCSDTSVSPNATQGPISESIEMGGSSGTGAKIFKYRQLFDPILEENLIQAARQDAGDSLFVRLPPNSYFEDENEQPISRMQMLDEEAKWKHGEGATAIVYDEPGSITRHGPSEPIRPDLWKSADAELMAHLWDTYDELIRSRWLRSPCKVTFEATDVCHADLPVSEDCKAVILPFRQLYSKNSADDLFNRCCKLHSRHLPRGHFAYEWVKNYQSQFNAFLDNSIRFPVCCPNLSTRRYLDAFAYGPKHVHASAKQDEPEADLNSLLASYHKERVVMGYHYILRTLLQYLSMAMPVLRQNVTHWVNDLRWAGGKVSVGRDLFGPR